MHPVTSTMFGLGAILAATTLAPMQAKAQAPYCREFQRNIVVGSRVQPGYGTACLQPDGSWQTVSENNSNGYALSPAPSYSYNTYTPPVYVQPQPVYVQPAPVVTYYEPEPVYYAYPQSSFSLSIGSGWNGHRYHDRDQYFSNGWNNGWHGNGGWGGRRWR